MRTDSFSNLRRIANASAPEHDWIGRRLDMLSVKERAVLRGALANAPPEDGPALANLLLCLQEYEICFPAENTEQLGAFVARCDGGCPDELLRYVETEALGDVFREEHPGVFADGAYVVFPEKPPAVRYDGTDPAALADDDWIVRLRLGSAGCPGGVWLRLPDYGEAFGGRPDEIGLALAALGADAPGDCTLLDARCSLPEAGNLMEQYNSPVELVRDGSDLCYVLEERGQGAPYFLERYAAALELEHCRTLALALDVSQNLGCYDYLPADELPEFAERELRSEGMSADLIGAGFVDLPAFADDLLFQRGYLLTADESGYVARSGRAFVRDRTAGEVPEMSMT